MGPEDFKHTVYNKAAPTAQQAFVTHLSRMWEKGKTSINRHNLLFTTEAILGMYTLHFRTKIQQLELNLVDSIPLVYIFMATLRFGCNVV